VSKDSHRGCQFASDNTAAICPEAWQAFKDANHGPAPAYGEDKWTARASSLLREVFETECEVFFCFNGTAANSMSIAHMCRSYHSVIAHRHAHVENDECGAPQLFSHGTRLLLAEGRNAKIDPMSVHRLVMARSDIHHPKPRVLSLTQATEFGTVYTLDELDALREVAHRHRLRIHMDGARFANAVAALDIAPKELTWKVGVDMLCLGGTKNGLPVGEAVVIFDPELAEEFDFRCKQAGQLASKMRFLSAPWVGMLEFGAWIRHAAHANAMADRLAQGLKNIDPLELAYPVAANAVFVKMPTTWLKALREAGWTCYAFIGDATRFMCSWATTPADVDRLLSDLQALAAGKALE
jgi:threonine aldolase